MADVTISLTCLSKKDNNSLAHNLIVLCVVIKYRHQYYAITREYSFYFYKHFITELGQLIYSINSMRDRSEDAVFGYFFPVTIVKAFSHCSRYK